MILITIIMMINPDPADLDDHHADPDTGDFYEKSETILFRMHGLQPNLIEPALITR